MNLALLAFFMVKQRGQRVRGRRVWPIVLAVGLLPLVVLFVWNHHVDVVFPAGAASNHAMRAERLGGNLAQMTGQQLKEVGRNLLGAVFSLGRGSTRAMLFWNVIVLALAAWQWRAHWPQSKRLLKALLFCNGVFVLYIAALYATYVTSMTYGEAVVLASYDRYVSSVFIYLSGILFWVLAENWAGLAQPVYRRVAAAGLVAPLLLACLATVEPERFARRPYEGTFYQLADRQIETLGLESVEYSYFVIGPEEGIIAGTTGSYLKYQLMTMDIWVVGDVPDAAWALEHMAGYDYLLVLEDNAAVRELFSGYPRFQKDESHIGLYHLPLW